MNVTSAALTHVGLVRNHNEDAFLADDRRALYAVADGMGGHAAGEVASGLAIDVLSKIGCAALDVAHATVHKVLLRNMEKHPDRAGMGTTLTVAVVDGDMLRVAHVGDSAAYLVRRDRSSRITHDQANGHVLMNVLGASPEAYKGAQHVQIELQSGDMVVLCSDGLTNYLNDEQQIAFIARGIGAGRPLEAFAQALVSRALAGGGQDNVTVVVVRVE
jgi:serine/threonine protein phosphatase PrpC